MIMVRHDGIGADVDSKDASQGVEFVFNPLAPVFVVVALVVNAAQEGAADAAGDDVIVGWASSLGCLNPAIS
jgi:hypothetical protein